MQVKTQCFYLTRIINVIEHTKNNHLTYLSVQTDVQTNIRAYVFTKSVSVSKDTTINLTL